MGWLSRWRRALRSNPWRAVEVAGPPREGVPHLNPGALVSSGQSHQAGPGRLPASFLPCTPHAEALYRLHQLSEAMLAAAQRAAKSGYSAGEATAALLAMPGHVEERATVRGPSRGKPRCQRPHK
jgi:hypothetical protein